MDAVFTAADITGLATNVSTTVLGFVAISLIFVGYRYLRKSGVK